MCTERLNQFDVWFEFANENENENGCEDVGRTIEKMKLNK